MAKWSSQVLMPPQTPEMRIPNVLQSPTECFWKHIIHNISIVLTDTNATIVSSSPDMMSQPCILCNMYVDPVINNGECCLLFCHNTGLYITDTWYTCKCINHLTWYGSDGTTRKAICISHCWQSCIINCRVYWGAQLCNTDHQLLPV